MKSQKHHLMMQRRPSSFYYLAICGAGLTACPTERFRHEKYKCNSGAFGIAEIIVNDTGVGDMAKIIGYGYEKEVKILSSSKSSITTKMDDIKSKLIATLVQYGLNAAINMRCLHALNLFLRCSVIFRINVLVLVTREI